MGYIIEDFKGEHRVIIASMVRAREVSLRSNDGYGVLRAAWENLVAHLRREDELIYGKLREMAPADARLMWLLNKFGSEAAEVTERAVNFLERVEQLKNAPDLAREFGVFLGMLRKRIIREEKLLFPEYERLMGGNERRSA